MGVNRSWFEFQRWNQLSWAVGPNLTRPKLAFAQPVQILVMDLASEKFISEIMTFMT